MIERVDVAIVGAGMAGASLAAQLAGRVGSLALIEAEDQPGYHSTGRSAAFWMESYGGPHVQPLTSASGAWLAQMGFLKPRGALHIADAEGAAVLEALRDELGEGVRFRSVGTEELRETVPGLRPGWEQALAESSCADIDVAALHEEYLRNGKTAAARLITGARVETLARECNRWRLETAAGAILADVVVNAAGAWADDVARRAGVQPLGFQPYRRTIAQLKMDRPAPADLPLVIDALGRFYFKPEAGGRLWLSPHDETACDPCDCAAEELDVAVAIDRLEKVVDWRVERVERRWAGLRTFAPDRVPVYGYDLSVPGFFWCAGQGGFGIQTAPAAAKLAAALFLGEEPALDPEPYRPGRFAT